MIMATKINKVKVRVLVDITVDGKSYKPNDAVAFEAGKVRSLEKAGQVDSNSEAVAYVLSQGAKVVEHEVEAEADQSDQNDQSDGAGGGTGGASQAGQ
jgi:hypothetical protein